MTKHEGDIEHLREHVRIVREQLAEGAEWPCELDRDEALDMDRDACEAWCYIDGYACALGMTAHELLWEYGLLKDEPSSGPGTWQTHTGQHR
jgi:hypothetical protein